MNMQLTVVNDERTHKEFLEVARIIYKDDKNWICPLDQDIKKVFSPEENEYHSHGEAVRWVLKDDRGNLAGRIAAFVNYNAIKDADPPAGGCGFFECINSQDAANALFEAAREWLKTKGVEAMDGPINFGENDKYWGLLVSGFTPPAYEVPYNHAYYQALWENFGFQLYYRQEGFHMDLTKEVPERFWKIAKWIISKPGFSFRHFSFKEIDKYVGDFTKVFNEAWSGFKRDFKPLKEEYVHGFLNKGRMVLEERFIWLAYYNDEPIAIYLMIPDINQIFMHFNGKLDLINKLRLVYMVKTKKIKRAKGILMGVVPKFQKHGIESGFIYHVHKALADMPHYKELEFNWVGDFNPPMRKLWSTVGAYPAKEYITYRYLFDRERKFERYPLPE